MIHGMEMSFRSWELPLADSQKGNGASILQPQGTLNSVNNLNEQGRDSALEFPEGNTAMLILAHC